MSSNEEYDKLMLELSAKNARRDIHKQVGNLLQSIDGALNDPITPAEASETVDGIIKRGIPLNEYESNPFKYNIASTREEFDWLYTDLKKRNMDKTSIMRVRDDPAETAFNDILLVRTNIMPVIAEMHKRGIDSEAYWNSHAQDLLKPGDIDLKTLDPRLTPEEVKYVTFKTQVARYIGKHGLLVSTPNNAPASSKWRDCVRSESETIAQAAIDKASQKR